MKRTQGFLKFMFVVMLTLALAGMIGFYGCTSDDDDDDNNNDDNNEPWVPDNTAENLLLDQTYRIDLENINVVYDFYPYDYYVDGSATAVFHMRPDQVRPVIHFDFGRYHIELQEIWLDNELLDYENESDIKIITYTETTQKAIEFQRDLDPNSIHDIFVRYRINLPYEYPYFFTDVNDIDGYGNEELWPTLNTPHELVRHVITINVHSSEDFNLIASGYVVESSADGIQTWTIDTEESIASYTLMFIVLPAADAEYRETLINNVPVRWLSFGGEASIDRGVGMLESWLPELETNLGPFPMARGLSVFLLSGGGGMEYYGGTMTSVWALEHEVFHMYFGCSTVARTYRDSWWDEAINMWYEYSEDPNFPAIGDNFYSDIVSGRSPIAVGFDTRGYEEGARIMQACAMELGGRTQMISFLKHVHANYTFKPFNTLDLLYYLQTYGNVDMYDRFMQWLYSEDSQTTAQDWEYADAIAEKHRVDLTPPAHLIEKYRKK
ncbi:hypothetical protein JXQ70_11615 [bacterium]|nr:hypothetical protein [bacterium]